MLSRISLILLTTLLPGLVSAQGPTFNADSAYAYVDYLSVTIGPRPMGSANDRRALRWVEEKFKSFGADTAYVMPISKAGKNTNTNSGVAIGIYNGQTDSTIVIGGHVDSSGRDIPGANDDASGTACVVELARIWAQREPRYTLLFAAFSGEEQGLLGSEYFVDHYEDIDKVALMLQIDMAGSEGWLIPFIDIKTQQSPKWLVEDSYALDRALGYNSLEYLTHFFSINSALDGAGSDHMPFQKKDIPAIDFTSGLNSSPIHTERDKIDFISAPMLARSGLLVDGLIRKYDEQGIPLTKKGNYMLWEVFGGRLFIPAWFIRVLDVIAVLLGVAAFVYSRKQRLRIPKSERVRFTGFKVFFFMVLIAIFTQLGEAAMQAVKGLRYPWVVPLKQYLLFAAIWTVAGVWVSLQLTRKWRFSSDPYVYTKRALVLLLAATVLMWLGSARLALYPALTLGLLSLAIFLPSPPLKWLLVFLAPWPMFRLMFTDAFPFMARTSTGAGFMLDTFLKSFLYSAALTLLLVIWYLPSLYLLSYAIATSHSARKLLKLFRKPVFGVIIATLIVGYGGYLFGTAAYNEMWRPSVRVEAKYNLRSSESTLTLIGNEYFRGAHVTTDSLDERFSGRLHEAELPATFRADWFTISGNERRLNDAGDSLQVAWSIQSRRPWYSATLALQVDTLEFRNVTSALSFRVKKDRLAIRWFSEPPDTLNVDASFALAPGAKLIREVTAVYSETPLAVKVTADMADVAYQTIVTYRDTLTVPSGSFAAGDR